MYVGPWQEFKLAKILQLKEKVQREYDQENQIYPMNPGNNNKPKAHSVANGGRLGPLSDHVSFNR